VAQLHLEFGSHLNAGLHGWKFAASYGEVMGAIHASAFVNANRDQKKQPKPFELPMPWVAGAPAESVSKEERAALVTKLLRRSAFAH
jgi:hypothetical protein